jgi:cellobiose phosphorylase
MPANTALIRLRIRMRRLLAGPERERSRSAVDPPVRARLLSAEQLGERGADLARSHRIDPQARTDRLLRRLVDNQQVIARAVAMLEEAVQAQRRLTPAAEWLIDNIHLVEEQIRIARRHFPKGYSRELPQIASGPSAGFPRVYDIALTAISHGDGRIDTEGLSGLVAAYQTVTPLGLGELWALPIMLRLALIENLRRISVRIIADRADRNIADEWADRFIDVAGTDPKHLVLVLADMVRSQPPMASSFVAELVRRLHGQGAALAMPLAWIEQWLADAGHGTEHLVQVENQHQAADQVSVSNAIGSIRYLAMMDWRDFVEAMSLVEHRLREDPSGTYGQMDFATRDHYRHVVERLAKRGKRPEVEVAMAAVALARARAEEAGADDVRAHVGYYLIEAGLAQLQQQVAPRRHPFGARDASIGAAPMSLYLLPIAAVVALSIWGLLGSVDGTPGGRWLALLAIGLGVIAFSELGISLVNWAATQLVLPRTLARMDFSKGIPPHARTLVVVPTMFGNAATIAALAEALEVRFLANRDENLHFALLTDFFDAAAAVLPGDDALLDAAQREIDALNLRYAPEQRNRFFLFHRPRLWNPREGRFIAHERKRGKLAALNRFLRRGKGEDFLRIVGDTDRLGHVRYVITLDTDTQLPRDAGRKFAGTLAHPLNRARFDEKRNRITRGYGILQPRVGTSMSGQRRSWYARIHGSEPGIDPYTRAVSDVYQDLFAEGSFVGKGIYDVDAFEHALHQRFPDNAVLSHDLLEGCYARAGLVSDVQLYEDYPARYSVDVKRRHRWIRGDWQLLPWLLPSVPRGDGRSERNPLSALSRGKIFDNLRRSLVPTAMVGLLMLGWLVLPQPLPWTLWVLAILFLPPLLASARDIFLKPDEMALPTHLRQAAAAFVGNLRRAPVVLACLPFEAWFSLDAIARTLWRLAISRRNLLQWAPSSEVERTAATGWWASVRSMAIAPLFALAAGLVIRHFNPGAIGVALPVLALWFVSPLLMEWLGRPRARKAAALSVAQTDFLGRLARRTWRFFECHVGPDDHWLPPDNMQEHPAQVVAHRTSPTNIGLALLANLTALDFGYLSAGGMAARTAATLATLQSLPRHRGHFYNWYDTRTLEPLPPRYLSSVDSGNLAGHLATLRQGLLALPSQPVLSPRMFQGLADTFGLLAEAMGGALPADGGEPRASLQAAIALPPQTLESAHERLAEFGRQAARLVDMAEGLGDEARFWAGVLLEQSRAAGEELRRFAPWIERGEPAPALPWSGRIPSLAEVARFPGGDAPAGGHVAAMVELAQTRLRELARLADVAADCGRMDFGFLFDATRELLAIGYCVDDRRLDGGYYDLLASEARLGSFVAIAQGQVPQDSWFALGRLLTEFDGHQALLSWSGSMFEYLMPQLVMPSYEGTLLDETARASVERQIAYGRQRGVPWGISESGYNTVDARMNYQYRAFGVPGLGLQRGLGQDLVIAPYASMLALMVAPEEACSNLQRLEAEGYGGRYGLYEAIDFTPARLPRGQKQVVVRSYMAHHQGMGLLALSYLLHDQPMQRRFCADPEFQATLLLLQERVPRTGVFHPHVGEVVGLPGEAAPEANQLRIFRTPDTVRPAVQMLSNGRYHVLVTGAGGGYSRLRDMAVTRWREDPTRDHWGSFCYLRDVPSGEFWSTSYQPACVAVEGYEAIFSDAKAEFRGRHLDFETHTEIAVSAEDDIELRRLVITNRGRAPREIEITSYAEVVLAPAISDELHPAFSNLFVQTELLPAKQAILCTRRPRAHDEVPPWMFQLMAVHNADILEISYETDRSRFIGRGNSLARPDALTRSVRLSDSQGSVLDPIVATRCRIVLAPEQTATIDMVIGVGADRGECTALIDKYRDRHLADRVFDLAWTHSQVVRRQIDASQADAQLYERLAGLVLYAHPAMRASQALLLQNRRGQSGLWGHAISGDLPIVLLKIADAANIELVRQLVQAHAYWRLKGLAVDLVIWNEDQAGYRQALQDLIMGLIGVGVEAQVFDRPGGIFVRPAQQISHEDRILLQSVARVIVSDAEGTLADQVSRRPQVDAPMPLLAPEALAPPPANADDPATALAPIPALQFDNGLGGFSQDGREYVVRLLPGHETPAPWSNVLANGQFGTVVSESGCGYTWAENAHEFRLTPWHNDPVGDPSGEAYYLRDEDSGRYWSPSPLPRRGEGEYRTRHGFGYTVYEHVEDGIASELWVYVARHDAVKFCVLKLRNLSGRRRDLSVTGYVEWVLGDLRARSHLHVVTERDIETGVMTARNAYSSEFGGRVAFFDSDADAGAADGAVRWGAGSVTGDRNEFLGRNGSLAAPAALRRESLSGRCGAGLDPCSAIQRPVTLAVGAESQIVFRLGLGHDAADAQQLAQRHRGGDAARRELEAVQAYWTQTLDAVQVRTPEPALDLLANGWLLYQTIACRYHARSGFYQSGGAYGFRDQLQDTMAMLHAEPALAREHLLRSAAHQFSQGDVQHWWHPPLDRGVRTRCSDDYLWLPLAACRYVETTGDGAVMDEPVPYLEGRLVNADEESYYDLPMRSGQVETIYGHCVRALQRGLSLMGERGLPLIATGDWNDGMNRVGEGGKGESVWLGFFLYEALQRFSPLARARGDGVFADSCLQDAEALRANLEKHAWDGAWYRRAWFDDGTPLGSTSSPECRIDSIAQSWSVLSGAGDPARARQAMASLSEHLVRRDTGVVQLLDPPFDKTPKDPGYIRGYVPGVRENGGQYTHAAIWATMAFAELGDRDSAWELLRMINPVNHALDADQIAVYKVEPYVVAADVYAVAPHVGRGGWTWYTGSAGWMYRLMTESLLGLRREGDTLRMAPCLPADWPGFEMDYRFGTSMYRLVVVQAQGATPGIVLDGVALPGRVLPLRDDGVAHQVRITLATP